VRDTSFDIEIDISSPPAAANVNVSVSPGTSMVPLTLSPHPIGCVPSPSR
jgi:hypothetical protein